nr:immunoglobulin-like domain-containing protein [Tumebacillus amylolyticus]
MVLTTALSPVSSTFAATGTTTASSVSVNGYLDLALADSWAQDAILQAKTLGLMSGDPSGNFRPLDTITRQELAVILTNLMNLKRDPESVSSYKDVTSAQWGVSYIEAVKNAGFMTGDGNDTFRPDDMITREELAIVLARAAKLDVQGKGSNLSVADKNAVSEWAKDHVQAAIDAGLMQGDGTNFNPGNHAQRQEVAMVAVNFVNNVNKPQVLAAVTDDEVTINGTHYAVASNLKGLLNAKNADVLKGAKLRFQAAGGTISSVTYLELTNSGTAATTGAGEFSGNLVLDGQNTTIDGNVKVAGDYISLNNLNVAGDLEVGAELKNDFYSKNLQVSGKTLVNGGDNNTVVFEDAKLKAVDVNKQDVRVEPKGQTQVEEVTVNANASIQSDASVTIPKLTVQEGAQQVDLGGNVGTVEVKGSKDTTITGTANISNVTAAGSGVLTLSTSGKIDKVEVANGTLSLGEHVKIDNLVLPDGKTAKDVVKDYDNHGSQVSNVNGQSQNQNSNGNGNGGTHVTTNEERVAYDKAALTETSLLGSNVSLSQVTSNLTLPDKGAKESKIDWASSNSAVMSNTGVVTRPAYLTGDVKVTLTATISKGTAQAVKSFDITVTKQNETDTEAVSVAQTALTDATLLGTNTAKDQITDNLTLPTTGADGTTIQWSSDVPSVVSADGTVTRPEFSAGDASVVLTATISKGDQSLEKKFTVTVLKQADPSIQDVQAAKDALQESNLLNGNESLSNVKGDLSLPTVGTQGTTIEWTTSDSNLVTTAGVVTRPEREPAANKATLTATIRKGNVTDTKTFDVTVGYKIIKVQFLALNDLHGKLDQTYKLTGKDLNFDGVADTVNAAGRLDYLSTYLKQREAQNPNTLVVHTGDATGGSSPVSALENDEPTIEALNEMNFSLGTVGNHEFDRGTTELKRLLSASSTRPSNPDYKGANFPLIAANVEYTDGTPVFKSYEIKEVAGEKIGFIGVVTRGAASMIMQSMIQDIRFTDETTAVNKAVAELHAQGVHSIVVLAHMDLTQNGTAVTGPAANLAGAIDPDVDVVFAAHNHEIAKGTVGNKLLVQAYEYGKAFADVDVEIDTTTHDIVSKNAEVVINDQSKVAPDPAVTAIIDKYTVKAGPTIKSVVGTSTTEMLGGYTGTGDNPLGNLIADGMRVKMNADFAMMNGGGIRTNLKAGPILWEDLFNIQPFNNVLTKVTVKGADITKILEAQLSVAFGSDYSIAGMKYTYNYSTQKVDSITTMDGTPIDPNKEYTIVVNNFMATGTNKYAPIPAATIASETGPEDLPALMDYVKSFPNSTVTAPELGRIKISNQMIVTNNTGISDSVTVTNLTPGDTIKVYSQASAGNLLGSATVASGQTSVTIPMNNLAPNGGTVYVSITAWDLFHKVQADYTEGVRFPVPYVAEPAPTPGVPTLTAATSVFNEAASNDGTVTGTEVLTLANGTFDANITKSDVTLNNLPAGLDYSVTRDSDTQLTINLSGKATNHSSANNAYVTATIPQAKVIGAQANVISSAFAINFQDPAIQTMAIANARQVTDKTQKVTIQGIVTANNSSFNSSAKLSTYIQDSSGGINLYKSTAPVGFDFQEGDELLMTGTITSYANLTEFTPDANGITLIGKGRTLPTPEVKTIADLTTPATAELSESKLIKVSGYLADKTDTPDTAGGYNLTLVDADFNSLIVRVYANTGAINSLQVGKWYDLTGILNQYNADYQLMPRKAGDVVEQATQAPAPSTNGVIKQATVLRGVDGDTVKLATAVYGATNVRFLSIDTPETVYNNMSQGPHGDAAHNALDQLLPPNTPVELHFGSEPKDKYGRLLAHVYKNGEDMNLRQVRDGMAATYQIYPNLDGFETYADALKLAKQEKLGIWNPADPLLEQPFVFRARLDNNTPLSKPVGDYYTKKYVDPNLWFTIPAENRVYFWNVADATTAGFTKFDYETNDTTLFSDVYQVDTTSGTVSGFPYGVSLETVNAVVKPLATASVKYYQADGITEITSGTLATGNKIVVTAADGTTTKVYTVNTDAIPLPVAVTNVTVTTADNAISAVGGVVNTIRWNDSKYGVAYAIYRSTTANFEDATSVGLVQSGAQLYTDATAEPGTAYTYFVVARNDSGDTPSTGVQVTTSDDSTTAPEYIAPSNVAAASSDTSKALVGGVKNIVTWTDSPDAQGATYDILRATTNDAGLATKIGTVNAGVGRYEDTNATAGTTYYYFVSLNANGVSLNSTSATVLTAVDNHLMISQVYGGGGATSGTPSYKYDFIELFNPSNEDLSLAGYSLQYGSGTGTSAFNVLKLNGGVVPAGGYYLVKLAGSQANTGSDLPIAADLDTTPLNPPTPPLDTLTLAATSGKVALVSNQTGISIHTAPTVIDFVGYGTTNDAEGNTAVSGNSNASVSTLSNITAAIRKFVAGFFQDTDNNKNDFTASTPNPHNSTSTKP